jgi:hypothetical protein
VHDNKTDRHDITEILLKVAQNTIKQTNNQLQSRKNEHIHEWCLILHRDMFVVFTVHDRKINAIKT